MNTFVMSYFDQVSECSGQNSEQTGRVDSCDASTLHLDADHRLLRRTRDGNLAAFEELVQKHRQRIVHFATRYLGDRTEAEDVAQNAFLLALRSAPKFRFRATFSSWLFTITRNLCRNELRRRLRGVIPRDADCGALGDDHEPVTSELPAAILSPDEFALYNELREQIDRGLRVLLPQQRAAIVLLSDHNLSYEEIAEVLGISLSATKTLIYRGRQRLRQKMTNSLR